MIKNNQELLVTRGRPLVPAIGWSIERMQGEILDYLMQPAASATA